MGQISLSYRYMKTNYWTEETRGVNSLSTTHRPASSFTHPVSPPQLYCFIKGYFHDIRHNHKSVTDCHQSAASYNQNDFVSRQWARHRLHLTEVPMLLRVGSQWRLCWRKLLALLGGEGPRSLNGERCGKHLSSGVRNATSFTTSFNS